MVRNSATTRTTLKKTYDEDTGRVPPYSSRLLPSPQELPKASAPGKKMNTSRSISFCTLDNTATAVITTVTPHTNVEMRRHAGSARERTSGPSLCYRNHAEPGSTRNHSPGAPECRTCTLRTCKKKRPRQQMQRGEAPQQHICP